VHRDRDPSNSCLTPSPGDVGAGKPGEQCAILGCTQAVHDTAYTRYCSVYNRAVRGEAVPPVLKGHESEIVSVTYNPDGKIVRFPRQDRASGTLTAVTTQAV